RRVRRGRGEVGRLECRDRPSKILIEIRTSCDIHISPSVQDARGGPRRHPRPRFPCRGRCGAPTAARAHATGILTVRPESIYSKTGQRLELVPVADLESVAVGVADNLEVAPLPGIEIGLS